MSKSRGTASCLPGSEVLPVLCVESTDEEGVGVLEAPEAMKDDGNVAITGSKLWMILSI